MSVIIKQSSRSALYTYAGMLIGVCTTFFIFPHNLSIEVIGLLSLLITIPVGIGDLCMLGFSTALSRVFPVFQNKQNQNNGLLFIMLLVGVLGYLLMLIFFPWVKNKYILSKTGDNKLIVNYIFWILILVVFNLYFSLLEVYARYSIQNTKSSVFVKEFVLRILFLSCFGLYYFKVVSLATFINLYCLSQAILPLYLIYILKKNNDFNVKPNFSFLNKQLIWRIISLCVITYGFSFLTTFIGLIETFVVNKYHGLAEYGVFTSTMIFGTVITVPMRLLHKIVAPILRDAFYHNKLDVVKDIYYKTCLNQLLIALFLFGGIWLNIDLIISLLPPRFAEGRYIILFLCLGNVLDMMTGCNDILIGTSNRFYANSIFVLIIAPVTYFSANYFIPIYGAVGIAISMSIVSVVYNLMRYFFILFTFKFQPFNSKTLWVLIIGGVSFSAVYYIELPFCLIIASIVKSILFTCIFWFCIVILKISLDINSVINKVSMKLFNKQIVE